MDKKWNNDSELLASWEQEGDLERIEMMFACVDKQAESVKERVREKAKEKLEKLEQLTEEDAAQAVNMVVIKGIHDLSSERDGEAGGIEALQGLGVPKRKSEGWRRIFSGRRSWAGILTASLTLAVLCGVGFGWLLSLEKSGMDWVPRVDLLNIAGEEADTPASLEPGPEHEDAAEDANTAGERNNRDDESSELESAQADSSRVPSGSENAEENLSESGASAVLLPLYVMVPIACAVPVFLGVLLWGVYRRRNRKKRSDG